MKQDKTENKIAAQYRHKILDAETLAQKIGMRPRKEKVVMCHGTFDIVHPGHVRHLIYAREKGDMLVVSLTSDEHILKADHRPYVPEELRAINLAALEMVNYVVIDRQPEPLENLAKIQPDYFVKGFEYQSGGLNPKTAEEKKVIDAYGGEVIFTPGDIVYSSSAIIEAGPPDLAVDKLAMLLEGEGISFDDLHRAVDSLGGQKVHLVGDTIVDSLTETLLIGASGKTPTFSTRFEQKIDFVGGAGIVAKHLRAAGGDVHFSTILGDDALKDFVLQNLEKADVKVDAIIDPTRPTTNKNAFVADTYRLLKVDTVDNRPISDKYLNQLAKSISTVEANMTIFSDFRHGIFNRNTVPVLTDAIPGGRFRCADSQVASRWGNILEFQGFDLITPNEKEARFALGDQDTVVRPLGTELFRLANCRTLMLKLGARGSITFRRKMDEGDDYRAFFVIDSFVQHVVDPVGSGDALLAYAGLTLKATGNDTIASVIGSVAAALECEIDGNKPVTPEAVHDRLSVIERSTHFS